MSNDKGIGVIVGRFQVPALTPAHEALIKTVIDIHGEENTIIFIGISPVPCTKSNPLDFYTRRTMIQVKCSADIQCIEDHRSDVTWSLNLDTKISSLVRDRKVTLYGSRDSFIKYYCGRYETKEIELPGFDDSGKLVRAAIVSALPVQEGYNFRRGVIWGIGQRYDQCFATVDIAVLRNVNGRTEVLLGKKPGEIGWRFPGGFSDPKSESYEDDAKRELDEECGISLETDKMVYVGSALVDDWRYRHGADKIKTLFFKCNRLFGYAVAGDDLAEVDWFPVDGISLILVENHKHLYEMLMETL